MTRAEIRRQEKAQAKKSKIYHLTQEQIDKIKRDACKDAIDVSFSLMLCIPTNVLGRCYWEKTASKRIPQFLNECLSVYESIDSGVLTVPELLEDVERLSGIKLDCLNKSLKKVER